MYNLSLPFGLGIISQLEKIKSDGKVNSLKPSDVEKLFEEKKMSQYFDYVHGIPIKTDFSLYPIVNYRQFEKYNGEGSFGKCIESLQNYLYVDKNPTN
jgi:hypothetical protein